MFYFVWVVECSVCYSGEQGMVDEAQKALEEAEALKKVCISFNWRVYFVVCTLWM